MRKRYAQILAAILFLSPSVNPLLWAAGPTNDSTGKAQPLESSQSLAILPFENARVSDLLWIPLASEKQDAGQPGIMPLPGNMNINSPLLKIIPMIEYSTQIPDETQTDTSAQQAATMNAATSTKKKHVNIGEWIGLGLMGVGGATAVGGITVSKSLDHQGDFHSGRQALAVGVVGVGIAVIGWLICSASQGECGD